MTARPLISVIIPTFNRAEYVEQAVRSVLAQTLAGHEVIVVDDGSTDDTRARLEPFTRLPNARYHYQQNRGRSTARNRGVEMARGEFLLFLDSDDMLFPDALENLHRAVSERPGVGMAAGQTQFVDEQLRPLQVLKPEIEPHASGNAYASLIRRRYVLLPGSFLLRRECLDKVGLFDPRTEPTEDYDFCLRVAMHYEVTLVDVPVLRHRLHGGNTPPVSLHLAGIRVARKHMELLAADGRIAPAARRRIRANWMLRTADFYYELGENAKALACYLRALAISPAGVTDLNVHRQILASLVPASFRERLRPLIHPGREARNA